MEMFNNDKVLEEALFAEDDTFVGPASSFKLPIEYLRETDVSQLSNEIKADLELCNAINEETGTPMYSFLSKNWKCAKTCNINLTKQIANFTTTDQSFLKSYQQIFDAMDVSDVSDVSEDAHKEKGNEGVRSEGPAHRMWNAWNEFKSTPNFKETYHYAEWDALKHLNTSSLFLQIMYVLNMLSPILTLLSPLMVFITPFLIIKASNGWLGKLGGFGAIGREIPFTFDIYKALVKELISQLAIVQLFKVHHMKSTNEIMKTIFFAFIYIYTTYQNAIACYSFNRKMGHVYEFMNNTREYADFTCANIKKYLRDIQKCSAPLHPAHVEFHNKMIDKMMQLNVLSGQLQKMEKKWSWWSYKTVSEMGSVMKLFYELKHDTAMNDLIKYSVQCNLYLDFIRGIKHNLNAGVINKCNIATGTEGKLHFCNNYYAPLSAAENPVKNNIRIGTGTGTGTKTGTRGGKKNLHQHQRNMIISGPNASGKTTVMKSVFLNIIFTQQFGVGFYDKGSILKPYKYLHCYLNIPDTSGRDSLFQAEARRCKNILDVIAETAKDDDASHFIIFDELFSGTNPYEAVKTSISFVKYLSKIENVNFMLTTHYKQVCKEFTKSDKYSIQNCQMKVIRHHSHHRHTSSETSDTDSDKLVYTYKIKPGISKVKGGMFVLKEMGYPGEVVESGQRAA
jgi:hypothetical protein